MAEAVAPLTYNPRVSLEMTADTPDLSIVLVNWNACEMTSAALE